MQAAAKIGISITLSPLGSGSSDAGAPTLSPMDHSKEWLPAFTPDEDGLLHQLRAYLMQALEASTRKHLCWILAPIFFLIYESR